MANLIEEFDLTSRHCNVLVDKKTSKPIQHHTLPDKKWDHLAVDLHGPMPSSNHVVVVTDLASRYPAAKLIKSKTNPQIIPALEGIYDTFGNPKRQISDNGPPFDSKKDG